MKVYNRSEWTAIFPRGGGVDIADEIDGLPNFQKPEVLGTAIHFVGSRGDIGQRDPRNVLEQQRKQDMDQKRWSDIMYNLAVAQEVEGVWVARGIVNKGAANGSGLNGKTARTNNSEYISLVCLVGGTENPTDLLFENILNARLLILGMYPTAFDVKPHFHFRATACPGEKISKVLFTKNGAPRKSFWDPSNASKPVLPEVPVEEFDCGLPPATLRLDSRNTDVYTLQNYLAFFGYYRVRVDGHFGPITRAAVMEVQDVLRRGGFYPYGVDGVYGPHTRNGWCQLLAILSTLA